MQESDPVLSHQVSGDIEESNAAPQLEDGIDTILKQQFFRLMSQEYRTSLSTILMSVDELEFDAVELDREEAELCRQQIRLAIEHMRHLLDEARENF